MDGAGAAAGPEADLALHGTAAMDGDRTNDRLSVLVLVLVLDTGDTYAF
ncbi:hypothetical protein ABT298_01900 [Streptomyces sp. NPDC001034]